MRLIRGGSSEARFTRLHQANSAALLGYFRRRLDDPADVADLVAETYLVLWRRIDTAPAAEDEARAWLYGVAYGVLLNHRRGVRRRLALADRLRAACVLAAPATTLSSHADALHQALEELPETDRELLQLTVWEGLTPTQAAATLGISAGAARTRLHRARARVRTHLSSSCN